MPTKSDEQNSEQKSWAAHSEAITPSTVSFDSSRFDRLAFFVELRHVLAKVFCRARRCALVEGGLILVWMYRLFPSILNAIIVVKPETVIGWHRRGFHAYWRWKSCRIGGPPLEAGGGAARRRARRA